MSLVGVVVILSRTNTINNLMVSCIFGFVYFTSYNLMRMAFSFLMKQNWIS